MEGVCIPAKTQARGSLTTRTTIARLQAIQLLCNVHKQRFGTFATVTTYNESIVVTGSVDIAVHIVCWLRKGGGRADWIESADRHDHATTRCPATNTAATASSTRAKNAPEELEELVDGMTANDACESSTDDYLT